MEIKELEEKITKLVEVRPGCKYVVVIQDGYWFEQSYKGVMEFFEQNDIRALVVIVNGDTEFSVLEVSPSDTTTTSTS